ncbi:MAG: universal stress protein [Solirubrobacterales bacterium]
MSVEASEATLGEALGDLRFRQLLVAIDGSASSELALSAAVVVAKRDGAKLTLISVSPHTRHWGGGAYIPDVQPEVDKGTERLLRDTAGRIPEGISVTTLFRQGKPGPQIVAAAAEGDYDAILLGARGVGRLGMMLGSVSHYVLHEAPIAVFVAHAPRRTGR